MLNYGSRHISAPHEENTNGVDSNLPAPSAPIKSISINDETAVADQEPTSQSRLFTLREKLWFCLILPVIVAAVVVVLLVSLAQQNDELIKSNGNEPSQTEPFYDSQCDTKELFSRPNFFVCMYRGMICRYEYCSTRGTPVSCDTTADCYGATQGFNCGEIEWECLDSSIYVSVCNLIVLMHIKDVY